jgi:hypothetical protein
MPLWISKFGILKVGNILNAYVCQNVLPISWNCHKGKGNFLFSQTDWKKLIPVDFLNTMQPPFVILKHWQQNAIHCLKKNTTCKKY